MANKPIDKRHEHRIATVSVQVGPVRDKTVNILYWPGYGIVMPAAITTNGDVWAAADFICGQAHNKRELEKMEPGTPVTIECTVLEGAEFVTLDYNESAENIRERLLKAARQFDEVSE